MNVHRLALAAFALLVSACGGSGGGGADPGPIPAIDDGPVLSAVGQFPVGVAYLADAESNQRWELHGAALDGSAYAKLSTVTGAESVIAFAWSPDRRRIAYQVADDLGALSLFVTSVEAPQVVPIAPSLSPSDFRWSPDSSRLALRDAQTSALWSVRADGTGLVPISTSTPADRIVAQFAWSPDSTRLAYVSDELVDDVLRLFVVPAGGGAAVEVSAFLSAGDEVGNGARGVSTATTFFAWSPDSSTIAFERLRAASATVDLLAVAADGTNPLTVFASPLNSRVRTFAWAPNGSRVAFLSRQGSGPGTVYSVLPSGADLQPLDAIPPFGTVAGLGFAWAPDSTRLALVGSSSALGTSAFVVPAAGGPLTGVGIFVAGGDPPTFTIAWSPDSSRFLVLDEGIAPHSLMVGGDGVAARSFGTGGSPGMPSFAPDGSRLAYLVDAIVPGLFEAVVSDEAGEYGTVRVSPPADLSRGATTVGWSTDGSAVLSVSDPTGLDRLELFAAAPDGTHLRRLSGPMVFGGQVTAWASR